MESINFQLLSDIYSFCRRPSQELDPQSGRLLILKRIVTLISWLYVIVFPLAIVITLLLKALNYDGVNAVSEFATKGDLWSVIFLGALLAPLIEEITFRLPLRFKPIYLFLASFFASRILTVYIARQFFSLTSLFVGYAWGIPLALSIVILFFLQRPHIHRSLEQFYANRFGTIYYALTILFGVLHITNYSQIQNILVIVLLLGIPQIIVGLVLGFVRIRYGFVYAVITHAAYNSFLLIPAALVKDQSYDEIVAKNGVFVSIFGLLVFGLLIYGFVTLVYNSYLLIVRRNLEI